LPNLAHLVAGISIDLRTLRLTPDLLASSNGLLSENLTKIPLQPGTVYQPMGSEAHQLQESYEKFLVLIAKYRG
jgi:hypothetical protein